MAQGRRRGVGQQFILLFLLFNCFLFSQISYQILLSPSSLYLLLLRTHAGSYASATMAVSQIAWNPIFRANSRDVAYGNYSYPYKEEMDKRRLFLQSYQFCRKKTMTERIRCSFFRVKRVVFIGRLRSAKIRRILCFFRNIRFGNFLISIRRRMFVRLHNSSYNYGKKIRRSRFSCLL